MCVPANLGPSNPEITNDGNGGCFVFWHDNRPPFTQWGAVYLQHYDADGNRLWAEDMFIFQQSTVDFRIISDGLGGCILQYGCEPNIHKRVNGEGQVLWTRHSLSWYLWGEMISGEPGFFYLIWSMPDDNIVYGQRVDMDGNNYWPTWGSGQYGAPLSRPQVAVVTTRSGYRYPYLYSSYNYELPNDNQILYGQALDSLGNRQWGDMGVPLAYVTVGTFQYKNAVPDDLSGLVTIFQTTDEYMVPDVFAKRANADGTLGGPISFIEDLTIEITGNDLQLNWSSKGDSVLYKIFKSEQSYVFPPEPDTTISDTFYVEVNGLIQDKNFYRIIWEP